MVDRNADVKHISIQFGILVLLKKKNYKKGAYRILADVLLYSAQLTIQFLAGDKQRSY